MNTSTVNNVAHAAKSQTKFNKDDFMIKDFGIGNDGNPFLTVEGKAGGTIPDKEDTGYVYVFVKIIQLIYDIHCKEQATFDTNFYSKGQISSSTPEYLYQHDAFQYG